MEKSLAVGSTALKALFATLGAGGVATIFGSILAGTAFHIFDVKTSITACISRARTRNAEKQRREQEDTSSFFLRKELLRRQAEALRALNKQRLVDAYWMKNDKEHLAKMEKQAEEQKRKAEAQRLRSAERQRREQERQQAEELRRNAKEHRSRAATKHRASEVRDAAWACTVLGVTAQASADEIKKAYIAGMKKNHPDQVSTMSGKIQAYFSERAKLINIAYDMLKTHSE